MLETLKDLAIKAPITGSVKAATSGTMKRYHSELL